MDNYCWVERRSHPTHIETLVEWALREGKDKIAVWGGDGTLSRAVQELYRLDALKKMAVALVPVGTANDFARNLGGESWKEVMKGIFSDKISVKNFDLGLLKCASVSRIFVNNAGFGRTKEALQRKKSKPLRDIFSFDQHKLQIEWRTDHVTQYETLRAILGIVMNGPFFNNGMYFSKDLAPDDGLLSAFFVPMQSKAKFVKKLLKARLGGSLNDEETARMDAHSIEVQSDREMYPQADGERVVDYGVEEISFSVMKGALRLIVRENGAG